MPRRTAAAAMRWSFSPSPRKICPTSNSATSFRPRRALRSAAATRPGTRLGRMSERSAAIGLASASAGAPPPNNSAFGLAMNDQVTASRRPSAASARLATRVRFCSGVSTGRGTPASSRGQRRRRHAVEAGDAHDLLDDVGLAVDVGAPVGHDRLAVLEREAEAGENRFALALRDVEADQALDFAVGEFDRARRRGRIAGDDQPRGLAAAEVDHHSRREFGAGYAEVGIDAALEAIARVGDDAELAPGLRDVGGVPQRALDQHVARRSRRSPNARRPSRRRSIRRRCRRR